MKEDQEFLAGASPNDIGQPGKELEGSADSFGNGDSLRKEFKDPGAHEAAQTASKTLREQGWIDTDADLNPQPSPQIVHEDPKFLEEHRVDEGDEIIPEPDPITGEEIATLKSRSKPNPTGAASQL